tara:strand:- start:3237 stop:4070 length:834 start_codon:yes stop_codon:yes gene_type:complete
MIDLTWEQVDERIKGLSLAGVKVWGVPRGGAIVSGLARRFGAIAVTDPKVADIALDDIIDSGKTASKIRAIYDLPVIGLVDKQNEKITDWVKFPWEEESEKDIDDSVIRVLEYIGEDVKREGLTDTPARVIKSWDTLFSGYRSNPDHFLKWFTDSTDEMIISKKIKFYSTCEHHMLPFYGYISIGYIPSGKVLGLSKFARIVNVYARRLQIQERLTREIGELIEPFVDGVAVHVEAVHLCAMARGVNQQEGTLVTNYLTGSFRNDPSARVEFFEAVK